MLDLVELEQLVAFSDRGTLSKVAEQFHISTPSITRSMQNLEECFGVPLFNRSKNKLELNETGKFAVEHARRLLYETEQTLRQVREFDRKQRTIVIKSCAPAPLWTLMHRLSEKCPGITISSSICQNEEVLEAWADGFWDTLCRRKMPASKFLVQSDEFTFNELVACSSLPCFVTDYVSNQQGFDFGRVKIPLADEEAKVTFHIMIGEAAHKFPCLCP